MSKLKKLLNSVFVVVVFLFTGTRLAIARILPSPQSSQIPPSAKVFALTEAAWLELRAVGDGANQDKSGSKSSDDKKEPSKSGDCDKGGSKSGDDNKGASPSGDDKKRDASPSGDDKKGDASKSGDCDNDGPGGGDGDTGGSGG